MLVFRSASVIRNHLALPAQVQARVKFNSTQLGDSERSSDESLGEWVDLGLIDCGSNSRWAGVHPSEAFEIRIRLNGPDGGTSRQFPSWSAPVTVPADPFDGNGSLRPSHGTSSRKLANLKVLDSSGIPLLLSVRVSRGQLESDHAAAADDIRSFASKLPASRRVVSLYAPYWIVDGTGLDLQYKSGKFIAGQVDPATSTMNGGKNGLGAIASPSRGLGELLDDSEMVYLPSRISFQVLMIGDEASTRLHVRRRLTRVETSRDCVSPWSDPVPLTAEEQTYHDTYVLPPPRLLGSGEKTLGTLDVEEPFAIRSRLVRAPDALGGACGTRLVHVVCRYAVVNELGREIEVSGTASQRSTAPIPADGRPRPFHFDDSVPVRFRPREFGWLWSGSFRIKPGRREVILRLRHKLKGYTVIASVEFHSRKAAGTCVIVFRAAAHPPYRIENHTMYPISYRQVPRLLESLSRISESSSSHVILPYHHAEFAWDEPEYGRRSVTVEVADFGNLPEGMSCSPLGCFHIDSISPGTELRLPCSRYFAGKVVADGPTTVLIISEPSAANIVPRENNGKDRFQRSDDAPSSISFGMRARFSHGFGLSIVDWKPQELVYLRLNDISWEMRNDGTKETANLSVASITMDNQLWVTPYPFVLRMGSRSNRRRNKRNSAFSLLWGRLLPARSGYGDISLLENVDISILPSTISVDGNLAAFAIEMVRRVKETGEAVRKTDHSSRNKELRRALDIRASKDISDESIVAPQQPESLLTEDLYSAVDYMATGALAAKLRFRYRPPDQTIAARRSNSISEEESMLGMQSKPRHKIYIENLRVSAIKSEISWSGPLPIASSLPRLMRPALTFEGLPVLLRPFSTSHAFATADEHLQALKSHYISIWRILDLLVGVLSKPTFLVRACIFTWRESFATALETMANGFQAAEKTLEAIVPSREPGLSSSTALGAYSAFISPIVMVNVAVAHGLSNFASTGASLFRYDASRHRASGGLVRSRNPRLFANVDGNDLLVEYVEGENAGKALLSRVRMGAHLGEGYIYHVKGTHLLRKGRFETDVVMDKMTLIFMLTFDRVLLLNGHLDTKFCEVVWEVAFADLVNVEYRDIWGDYGIVLLWYLLDESVSREERHARSLVVDAGGLEVLHCKRVLVPKDEIKTVLSKIKSIYKNLVEPRDA
jgi:hypothetical protein